MNDPDPIEKARDDELLRLVTKLKTLNTQRSATWVKLLDACAEELERALAERADHNKRRRIFDVIRLMKKVISDENRKGTPS